MRYLAAAMLLVCFSVEAQSDRYDQSTDSKKIAWMQKGMEAVKSRLKDPGSADFRNVFFHQGKDAPPMTCGEVNSKNSFGGYIGHQRFVSAGKPDLTFLESDVRDFGPIWARFCVS